MKRTALVLAAALLVLVAKGWVVISSLQNRSAADGGTVELTERELRLPPVIGDSTAILLDLRWRTGAEGPEERRSPEWLNAAKLTELGFDCSVPVTSPHARKHYAASRTAVVYLVLEYEGEAWQRAHREPNSDSGPFGNTHLFAVDAGRDARRLREKYPDTAHHIITRAAVTPHLQERGVPDGKLLSTPRLSAWIQTIVPDQIFVPAPLSKLLQPLRSRLDQGKGNEQRKPHEPRFAATVSWGKNFEPWLRSVRLLPGATSQSPGTTR